MTADVTPWEIKEIWDSLEKPNVAKVLRIVRNTGRYVSDSHVRKSLIGLGTEPIAETMRITALDLLDEMVPFLTGNTADRLSDLMSGKIWDRVMNDLTGEKKNKVQGLRFEVLDMEKFTKTEGKTPAEIRVAADEYLDRASIAMTSIFVQKLPVLLTKSPEGCASFLTALSESRGMSHRNAQLVTITPDGKVVEIIPPDRQLGAPVQSSLRDFIDSYGK